MNNLSQYRALLILTLMCSVSTLFADTRNRLVVEDIDGNTHDLTEAINNGRRVVLIFWQSWCGSCKKEAPDIVAASERLKGKADFYGVVSGEDEFVNEDKVHAFIKKYRLNYPQVRDRSLAITKRFNVNGTPTIIVLGENHNVLYHGHHLPAHLESL